MATFASNVDRVQQVVNTAYKYGRKVVVEGRSMVNIIDIASKLGYIRIPEGTLIDIERPEGTLIDIENLKNYPPESTVLITTGSQGESMAALSRMAASIHKKVSIMPGDVVILSSHPIPGNEKAVANVINDPCFRPCLPGGSEADLFPGSSQVFHPHPRRVPPPGGSEGTG